MKKILFFAMMTMVTLGLTACGDDKEDEITNGPLVGSQWSYSESETETDEDGTWITTTEVNLKFTEAAQGIIDASVSSTFNGQSQGSYPFTITFTYTYDGTATEGSGVITMSTDDPIHTKDEDETGSANFTVKDNVMTIVAIDEDTGDEVVTTLNRQ